MATTRQLSFAGGEISPDLYGRVDLIKYATGLRTCRNFIVARHGGAFNRPGSQFVAEVKDSTKKVKLIPFIFNPSQTYILEFGDLYLRVHRDGVQQRLTPIAISAVTQASPARLTTGAAHGLVTGDEIFISGVEGMTELNNRNFKVVLVDATNVDLKEMDNTTDLDSTGFGAYTTGGTIAEVFELVTPYLEAELPEIQFTQSNDVITLVHPNHAPRELSRTDHTVWSLDVIIFEPSTSRPTGLGAVAGVAGGIVQKYKVTAIDRNTNEESLAATLPVVSSVTITGATQANPVVITAAAHGYDSGDTVIISGIIGMVELNGKEFEITKLTASTFELNDVDGTGFAAYISGGKAIATFVKITAGTPTLATPHVISWDLVTGASEYVVYKEINGVYGFILLARGQGGNDIGTIPNTSDTPPFFRNPFDGAGNFPSAVAFHQQRILYANTNNKPDTFFGSRTGFFKNFTLSTPVSDDDAFEFALAGGQVNEIRHMINIGRLIILTTGGEWALLGDDSGKITPRSPNAQQYTYNGSAIVRPVVIAGNVLYLQERGSLLRDLGFDISKDGYEGDDLSIHAAHLVENFSIVDFAWQRIPHSVAWSARDDGTLLGVTYLPRHQLLGWHRHDFTDGKVENVQVVPNDAAEEDSLYIIVNRTIDGRVTRYLEFLATRKVKLAEDSIFVDSALSFDGRNITPTTMKIGGGPPWTATTLLTISASDPFFTAGDVGNEIHFTAADGKQLRFKIEGFTSPTVVTGKPHRTVPVDLQNVATTAWSHAIKTAGGLWHLEGQKISALGDGLVAANANDPDAAQITVTNGLATFPQAYAVLHIGKPIVSDLETLDLDTIDGETLADKNKLITQVTLFVESSRGIFAGAQPPSDDATDLLEGLDELKDRQDEDYDCPPRLVTDKVKIPIGGTWNNNGRVFVRQIDPIPLAVLAVAPSGLIPFRR